MKKYEYVILTLLVLYEFLFPFEFYKKNDNIEYTKQPWTEYHNIQIQNILFQKFYLMPNGKYVDAVDTNYISGVVPIHIKFIANKFENKDLISFWVVNSDWGKYSFGNNPFGIEYNDVKKLINIPNTAVVLTKKNKWITTKDSNYYKLSFVKLASFESQDECFKTYSDLLEKDIIKPSPLETETANNVKLILDQDKKFKDKMDTMKVNFFKSDTISISDSIYIISLKGNIEYTKHYLPNFLLIGFLLYLLTKYKKYFK